MTYQNDSNINKRKTQSVREERSYTGWIVGAVVALAVILGIFALSGRSTDKNSTASNTPTSTSNTTGSATPNTPSTTTVPKSDPAPATTPAPAR